MVADGAFEEGEELVESLEGDGSGWKLSFGKQIDEGGVVKHHQLLFVLGLEMFIEIHFDHWQFYDNLRIDGECLG